MRIGIIGAGHMGSALARGLVNAGYNKKDIMVSDPDEKRLEPLKKIGIKTTADNRKTVAASDVVFLAVRPNTVEKVLEEIRKELRGVLLVSIAAGITTKFLEEHSDARIVRAMPNMGAEVGEMASCYCLGRRVTVDDDEVVGSILRSMGLAFKVDEEMIDAVTGLSGSGLAYFYLVIKAMRDAGRELGLPEEIALKLAAQTAKGAASIVLTKNRKPEDLIEEVCTPGGTTAEGISILRKRKVEGAVREAARGAARRARELSR